MYLLHVYIFILQVSDDKLVTLYKIAQGSYTHGVHLVLLIH